LLATLVLFPAASFCQAAASSPSNGQALSVREYVAELDRCSAVLNGSQRDGVAIRQLREELPSEWTVKDGSQTFTVKTGWLAGALAVFESNAKPGTPVVKEARERLAALRQTAEGLADSSRRSTPDLTKSRAQLDHILNTKEFQSGAHGPSWLDTLKARIYSWIWDHLEKLFKHIGVSRSISSMIAWILVAVSFLVLAFWAVRFFVRGSAPGMDIKGASRPGHDWRDWLREARGAAERGDYRAAIHAAYWAAVARLEDTNLLPQDRSRTPRESLRLIRQESAEYAPLAQLTRRFELVWYGYRVATATDWGDAMEQLERLGCLRSSTPAIAAS
jgi:hypothetical protein